MSTSPGETIAGRRVKKGADENIYDVHSDHLDTPRMLTDSADVPSWRASYEAFGRAYVSTDPDGSVPTPNPGITFNLRFPGQYYDAESGLHYNRFRYYSPEVGRYISEDPIGQYDQANLFLYASNNPLSYIDFLALNSYLVSRPLNSKVGGAVGTHNFVVTHADYPGDPNGQVYSYGRSSAPDSAGQVGQVDASTTGLSQGTSDADLSFWFGLAPPGQQCPPNPPASGPGFQQINAPDDAVSALAQSVTAPQPNYQAVPFGGNANSNSAAQAIANTAQGSPVPTPNGYRTSPGAGKHGNIRFHGRQ